MRAKYASDIRLGIEFAKVHYKIIQRDRDQYLPALSKFIRNGGNKGLVWDAYYRTMNSLLDRWKGEAESLGDPFIHIGRLLDSAACYNDMTYALLTKGKNDV